MAEQNDEDAVWLTSQPDRHHLSCLVAKMILVAYKSDAHPPNADSQGSVGVKLYGGHVSFPHPNQKSGPLAGHVRRGRTYRSPLAATGVLQIGDWVRDDLPDLLWPVLTLSELGTAEAVRFVRWQKAVQEDLSGEAEPRFIAECLDGRLTNLDRLGAQVPGAKAVIKAWAGERGLLPESVVSALAPTRFDPLSGS